ncbi:phosphatidylinositol-3-phosphatase YMR1 [Sporobolomyces salmoneus]|uniref:phosphatidylinositol-3-phosphatase YMR1 n=1 Tax=Sporobolomyces salmoneus TaxID=183962 RepID=UPI0031781B80
MEAIKRTTVPSVRFSRRHGTSSTASSDAFHDSTLGSLHLSTHHIIFERQSTAPTSLNGTPLNNGEKAGEVGGSSGENSNEVWIPLSLLHSVTRTPPSFTGSPSPLLLRSRDFFTYSISFTTSQELEEVYESIKTLCAGCSMGGLENRWAFFHHSTTQTRARGEKEGGEEGGKGKGKGKGGWGWELYDPQEEFGRMGLGKRSKAWRFTEINTDFNFCPSYPAKIVVPARISDTTLNYAVKYRSKCRIPGLVYLHWANLGSITRSSQPMVGITQTSRSIQDEKLIEAIFTSHSHHSGSREAYTVSTSPQDSFDPSSGGIVFGATATNVIIDARPTKNAYANSVKGAGTENMTFYKNCRKEYLGIDNIHVMRSSLNGVFQALTDAETTGQLDRLALRRTNWLSHLTNILEGVLIVIRTIHLSNSHVLVHCSDGWDRTSQLSALPQICLDPFYRTARGLAVLIEKDWISYGHKFTDRSGLLCNDRVEFNSSSSTRSQSSGGGGSGGGDEGQSLSSSTQQSFLASVQKQFASSSHAFKETCPVFQQFLDCIYQIQRQFPERFEWNERLLRKLVWETYSGKSGSFLFNSELERSSYRAKERTRSVWEEIFDLSEEEEEEDGKPKLELKEEYRNPLYDATLDDPESKAPTADQGVLLFDPQDVRYWFELFGRSDDEMNRKPPVPTTTPQTQTQTEHHSVLSPSEDPVLHPLSALSLGSPSDSHSRATSPLPSRSSSGQGEPQQLAETVQKFGWSAWKTVQKFGQEAAKQYKERTAVESTSEENGWSSTTTTSEGGERERTSNGNVAGAGGGGGSGMWSRFSTLSTNPWQQQSTSNENENENSTPLSPPPPSSSSTSTSTSSPSISYTPYQPRKAPHPVRQPSSALSINPWETISKEDALPTPLVESRSVPVVKKEEQSSSSNGGGGDPLGVGGF